MAMEQSLLEEMIVGFCDRQVFMFGDFMLKSGRRSPIYYNQRVLTSFSKKLEMPVDSQCRVRDLAVMAYAGAVDELPKRHDHLYPIPQAMTSLGAMVADKRGDSVIWGRVGGKNYGAHSDLEGTFEEGDTLKQLDDVVTSAESKFEAAATLKKAGLKTGGFAVMLDREEGGAEKVRAAGYDIVCITGLSTALTMLHDNGRIDNQVLDDVTKYHESLRADGLL